MNFRVALEPLYDKEDSRIDCARLADRAQRSTDLYEHHFRSSPYEGAHLEEAMNRSCDVPRCQSLLTAEIWIPNTGWASGQLLHWECRVEVPLDVSALVRGLCVPVPYSRFVASAKTREGLVIGAE